MAATAMMTLRIDPALLAQLKARARLAGRSTSAEVLRVLRDELARSAAPSPARAVRTAGMFEHLEAPDIDVFRDVRRRAGARALAAARGKTGLRGDSGA